MAKRKTRGRGRGRGKSASANVTSESENSVLKTPRTDAEGEETDASTVSKRSTRSKSGGDKDIPAKKAKTEDVEKEQEISADVPETKDPESSQDNVTSEQKDVSAENGTEMSQDHDASEKKNDVDENPDKIKEHSTPNDKINEEIEQDEDNAVLTSKKVDQNLNSASNNVEEAIEVLDEMETDEKPVQEEKTEKENTDEMKDDESTKEKESKKVEEGERHLTLSLEEEEELDYGDESQDKTNEETVEKPEDKVPSEVPDEVICLDSPASGTDSVSKRAEIADKQREDFEKLKEAEKDKETKEARKRRFTNPEDMLFGFKYYKNSKTIIFPVFKKFLYGHI